MSGGSKYSLEFRKEKMNNMIGGRQGYYQDGNPRLSSSSSSSPSAAAADSLEHHHHHHKGGIPVSYYSFHPRPPGWDIEKTGGGVGGPMRWNYGGGRGGGRERGANTSQLHDQLMMISMDSSSSPTPAAAAATTTTNNNNTFNLLIDGGGEFSEGPSSSSPTAAIIEREHMFDKVVTPSDVGKLNRLVIPKQHAEKYFPLDSSTNEKGLLLNFEDRSGKPWRFRYSYWNSSQSYVMTKGWSRFVKEKKLDAGDIVSFQRGLGELSKDRLFIDWRRRPDAPPPSSSFHPPPPPHHHHLSFDHPWTQYPPYYLQQPQQHPAASNLLLLNNSSSRQHQFGYHHHHHLNSGGVGVRTVRNPCSGSLIYFNRFSKAKEGDGVLRGIIRDGEEDDESTSMVFESVPVVQGKASAKRLRLFGVNMDCPIDLGGSDPYDQLMAEDQCGGILSSTAVPLSTTLATASQSHHLSSSTTTSSSSSISISPMSLNLGPYNINNVGNAESILGTGTPSGVLNKGKASMSFDLDI